MMVAALEAVLRSTRSKEDYVESQNNSYLVEFTTFRFISVNGLNPGVMS